MRRSKPVLFALAAIALGTGCFACGGPTASTMAPVTGGTASAARGTTTMCQPYQVTDVAGGTYTVQDDEWGSSAAQCVSTTGGTGFTVGGSFSDISGDLFGQATGGATGRQRAATQPPRQGADIEHELEIAFDEAISGSQRALNLTIPDRCAACTG